MGAASLGVVRMILIVALATVRVNRRFQTYLSTVLRSLIRIVVKAGRSSVLTVEKLGELSIVLRETRLPEVNARKS
jgi:hypothetical protein